MAAAPSRVGFVGAGWRTTPYLLAMEALPDEFEPIGAVTRTEASAERMRTAHGLAAITSLDDFLAAGPYDFVILSVPWPEILPMASRLLEAGVAVLSETPIAERTELVGPFLERFGNDARLQSAEQYRFQPTHAARIAVAQSGLIGEPISVTASFAHDYHALSVVRAALGIGFEPVQVTAVSLGDRGVQPLGRDGWASALAVEESDRLAAQLVWPERGVTATYDFAGEQYFSPIRSRHITIRGTHGELADDRVVSMLEPGEPVVQRITRADTGLDGDLEGRHLRAITLGERVLWRNPFGDVRLSDDELAVATVLRAMRRSVNDGVEFYGIADAAEDQYLSELMQEAARTGQAVTSGTRAWSDLRSLLAR
jgi:predicted dehydrogenase